MAVGTDDVELRVERKGKRRPFGCRVGMSEATADGAACSDRDMPDFVDRLHRHRAPSAKGCAPFNCAMSGHRTEDKCVIGELDAERDPRSG